MRDDLFRKIRHREHFTKQDVGLALYGTLGVAFTIFALYSSYRYWKTLFGPLVTRLWDGGTYTRILLIALAVVVIGPVVRGRSRGSFDRPSDLGAFRRIRFRSETRWRVEAAELTDASRSSRVPVDV
jgi:hypothetical protein